MEDDIVAKYRGQLAGLRMDYKRRGVTIALTMLAEDYIPRAPVIVDVILQHLANEEYEVKLAVMFLIDSIVSNVKERYVQLFTQHIVPTFYGVFKEFAERERRQLWIIRGKWTYVFPPKELYAIDVRCNAIDRKWTIRAPPPATGSVYLNPKFIVNKALLTEKTEQPAQTVSVAPAAEAKSFSPVIDCSDEEMQMKMVLLTKRKELIDLKTKRVEMELSLLNEQLVGTKAKERAEEAEKAKQRAEEEKAKQREEEAKAKQREEEEKAKERAEEATKQIANVAKQAEMPTAMVKTGENSSLYPRQWFSSEQPSTSSSMNTRTDCGSSEVEEPPPKRTRIGTQALLEGVFGSRDNKDERTRSSNYWANVNSRIDSGGLPFPRFASPAHTVLERGSGSLLHTTRFPPLVRPFQPSLPFTATSNTSAWNSPWFPNRLPLSVVQPMQRQLHLSSSSSTTSTCSRDEDVQSESDPGNDSVDSSKLSTPTSSVINVSWGDNMKERRSVMITQLYTGWQCTQCGLRFPEWSQTLCTRDHLDWHFRQNRRAKDNSVKLLGRKWSCIRSLWTKLEDNEDFEEKYATLRMFENPGGNGKVDDSSSSANASQESEMKDFTVLASSQVGANCPRCRENFESYFDDEREEWRYRNALWRDDNDGIEVLYHATCYHQDSLRGRMIEEDKDATDDDVVDN